MAVSCGISAAAADRRSLDAIFPQLTSSRLLTAVTDAALSGVSSLLTHTLIPLYCRYVPVTVGR